MTTRFIRFTTSDDPTPLFGTTDGQTVTVLYRAPWLGLSPTRETVSFGEVRLLAPVVPSKIVCIGLNYHAHVQASFSAEEAPAEPLMFLKPSSSIIGPNDLIVHPTQSERVDYEAELAVIIGRRCRNVSESDAESVIFGFTCVNDVTARDLQKKDGQWSRAKGFDTFCPVGPWIVPQLNWRDVLVEGILNEKVMQSGRTSQMIFPIPRLIAHITAAMTLEPGDVISTGTPSGIAPMESGDTIEVRVEGIGSLINRMA